MSMKALFIGRFQPFHNGHLGVIKEFSREFDKIIIGIGSSQYSYTRDNPFTAEERERMIRESLRKEGIDNFEIYMIPDIHNYPRWVRHVENTIPEKFDVVIARNPVTLKLFKEKGYTVKRPPRYGGEDCKGEVIRYRIARGEKWRHLVPDAVAKIIDEVDGVERIKKLYMD